MTNAQVRFGELRASIARARRRPERIDQVLWWCLQGGQRELAYTQRALLNHPNDLSTLLLWLVTGAPFLHTRLPPTTSLQDTHRWICALAWLLIIKREQPGEAACLLGVSQDSGTTWLRWMTHRGYGPGFQTHPRDVSGPGERITFDLVSTRNTPPLNIQSFPGQKRYHHDAGVGSPRAFVRTPHGDTLVWPGLEDLRTRWIEGLAVRYVEEQRTEASSDLEDLQLR